jgi:hypothetical protein
MLLLLHVLQGHAAVGCDCWVTLLDAALLYSSKIAPWARRYLSVKLFCGRLVKEDAVEGC